MPLISCTEQLEIKSDTSGYSSLNNSELSAKWSTNSFPLNIRYDQNFEQSEIDASVNAALAWENSIDNSVTLFDINYQTIAPDYSKLNQFDDNQLGIYKIDSWPEDLPQTALAVTQVFGDKIKSSGETIIRIDHADILVNYDLYTFVTDGTWGYDLESILLHEMGHFLGLKHNNQSSKESVMYPSISKYDVARTPKSQDVIDLYDLYPSLNQRSIASSSIYDEDTTEENLGRVTLQLEIYPNGKEIIKIIEGDTVYETHTNCHHNH